MKPGYWLLPTKGRPGAVADFFIAWRKTLANTPGYVLVNADEDLTAYDEVPLPSNWQIVPVTADSLADCVNTFWITQGDVEWVGLLCDDHRPETSEWDTKLIERVTPHNFVTSANGSQEHRMHGAIVYGGELLRRVGWIYPPGVRHSFHDDAWELIGNEAMCWTKVPEVMVRHLRDQVADATGKRRDANWNHDEAAYKRWIGTQAGATVKAVAELQVESGAATDKAPDLSDVSLMICTPNYGSSVDRIFMRSIIRTLDYLRAIGIKVEFDDAPAIAEPGYARALIGGAFDRSPHTNVLMIDDDMGWKPQDIVRMLQCRYDLVAVAGPRKTEHMAFAANVTPEEAGRMYIDPKTGAMGLSEVGAAFLMISRNCWTRMKAAYPDLEFDTPHGAVEHDLFQNLIVKRGGRRERLSEDFSFCYRWKKIGGRVMVLPDINLDHAGRKVWSGKLNDLFAAPMADAAD